MAPSGSGVGGTGRAAARGESSDPREQRRELVPVLGAASACALGSVILMSQASPLLAGSICAGDRSKTLKLLAQAAVCRSAAAITFLPLIGRLSDRYSEHQKSKLTYHSTSGILLTSRLHTVVST